MTPEITDEDRRSAWPYAKFHCLYDAQMRQRWFEGYYDNLPEGVAIQEHANRRVNGDVKADLTRFFDILNIREESDEGRVFAPVYISSCRVMLSKELGEILQRLEAAVDYKKKGSPE